MGNATDRSHGNDSRARLAGLQRIAGPKTPPRKALTQLGAGPPDWRNSSKRTRFPSPAREALDELMASRHSILQSLKIHPYPALSLGSEPRQLWSGGAAGLPFHGPLHNCRGSECDRVNLTTNLLVVAARWAVPDQPVYSAVVTVCIWDCKRPDCGECSQLPACALTLTIFRHMTPDGQFPARSPNSRRPADAGIYGVIPIRLCGPRNASVETRDLPHAAQNLTKRKDKE